MQKYISLVVIVVCCGVGCGAAPKGKPATTQAGWWDEINAPPDPKAAPSPKWIWGPQEPKDGEERYFRITFDAKLPTTHKTEDPHSAWLWAAGDNEITVYVNGKSVARSGGWDRAVLADVRSILTSGQNVVAIKCKNETGPAAICAKLVVRRQYGEPFQLVSDEKWRTTSENLGNWRGKKTDESKFVASKVIGPYGVQPWGELAAAVPSQATPVEHITVPAGFKVELLHNVKKGTEGSWVSMTPDPKGRLYVSDQAGPLFRVTPGKDESSTVVEPVELDIGHAQGMLWALDSLYVVVNDRKIAHESGLYRLRDTDGDDKLDEITTLKKFGDRAGEGAAYGEHGPHAIVQGPDKKLYLVAGNFTSLPDGFSAQSPAANWSEDLLLERMKDGRGHDPTIYAPGGWVCRTDPDGKNWEAIATGFRNAYDIAFLPDGELFTFDSDMEWDIGAPWWRPIRICHVVSGAEFGWRNGSAKWPPYYPDSVPAVLDLGMGSPTGVTFGTGAKFPAKYQRAFFASDWAYGKIYAVHLKPDGAGYKATAEPFLVGKPFDVTDVMINHDGAMYVTIGGRGTQSGLYRVRYVGKEATAAAPPVEDLEASKARELRRKLESYHGKRDPSAIDVAWPQLESSDRFIRYAARVAIEAQDPALWTHKALEAKSPRTLANGLVALCRVGNRSLGPKVLEALKTVELAKLPREQLLEMLRAYELCFIRLGRPTDGSDVAVAARLDALFPNEDADVNHELCQLLVFLEHKNVIGKSLALLEKAKTQEEQLFYAFQLRNLGEGWTPEQRETYFKWLNKAESQYTGGASYKLFLKNVREDAIKTLGDNEKVALGKLLKTPMELAYSSGAASVPARKFVKHWQMADLLPKLSQAARGRSFEKGKAAYAAVSCAQCHRFSGAGGGSGPDISGVGSRFQAVDLLEAILLPSKVISDQYQATEIITKKKRVVMGTIQEENDEQVVVRSSPLSTQTETVKKKDIATRRPSKLSIMPEGLIDVLSEEEVLDLLAYLRSAGDAKDPAFASPAAAGAN